MSEQNIADLRQELAAAWNDDDKERYAVALDALKDLDDAQAQATAAAPDGNPLSPAAVQPETPAEIQPLDLDGVTSQAEAYRRFGEYQGQFSPRRETGPTLTPEQVAERRGALDAVDLPKGISFDEAIRRLNAAGGNA